MQCLTLSVIDSNATTGGGGTSILLAFQTPPLCPQCPSSPGMTKVTLSTSQSYVWNRLPLASPYHRAQILVSFFLLPPLLKLLSAALINLFNGTFQLAKLKMGRLNFDGLSMKFCKSICSAVISPFWHSEAEHFWLLFIFYPHSGLISKEEGMA